MSPQRSTWVSEGGPREPVRLARSLGQLGTRLGLGGPAIGPLVAAWPEVVGEALAARVRPARLEGSALVVVTDDPAWATQTRLLADDVAARLRQAIGGEVPTSLVVRVRR